MDKKLKRCRFYLRQLQSPTLYNLSQYLRERGWSSARFNFYANFSERNLQFNALAAERLEFKHLLAQLAAQYCPEVMPVTFGINDHNWMDVLNQLALRESLNNLTWILKPALLNNGRHIKILENLDQVGDHYLSSNRMGGEHVLQQYLTNPHLLRGHKYSIRMFVVATNYAGAYIYPHGYLNVALNPYQPQKFTDLSSHLTNEHLSENAVNVIQIPTQRFELFPDLFPKIKTITAKIMDGLRQLHPEAFVTGDKRALALFGFDFLVDANLRPWLLEANHGPCFPKSDDHPLQKYLYYDFWQALIDNFVSPIALDQPVQNSQVGLFEKVSESQSQQGQ